MTLAKFVKPTPKLTVDNDVCSLKKAQYESVADDWYRRAQLALKRSNNEGLAREALARREQTLQTAATFQQQVDGTGCHPRQRLYEGMKALKGQIIFELRLASPNGPLVPRLPKALFGVNDMLMSGLSGTTSMDAFRRMEDKVAAALEASTEVPAETMLSNNNNNMLLSSLTESKMDMEREFQRLESSDAVEQELETLRATMMLPSSSPNMKTSVRISVRDVVKESVVN